MSLNPELDLYGVPTLQSEHGETIILENKNVEFEIRTQARNQFSPILKGEGTLYLTNQRLILIPAQRNQ